MAVLGAGALAALKGYLWVQDGEYLKAFLLGAGTALGLVVGGWGWWRWKQARSRVYDPLLIREKVGRVAFDAELEVTAVLPDSAGQERAREILEPVAAAYRHYDHPRRSQVPSQRHRAGGPPGQPLSRRPRTLWETKHPGRPRGGRPVAPARRAGRDAPGGTLRLAGAAAPGPQRQRRRPGGRHHRRDRPAHPLPGGPAAPPPPLRGPHPHGQVHPDAPHRCPTSSRKRRRDGTATPLWSWTPTPTWWPESWSTSPSL